MKRIHKVWKRIILLLFALNVLTGTVVCQNGTSYPFRLSDTWKSDNSVNEILSEYSIPGAAVAIIEKDSILIRCFGFADRERKQPVDEKTIFRLGSISKTYLAIAVMQLAEEGKINLNDPAKVYIPEINLKNKWEEDHPVRVIHLLEHTSSIDDVHFNEGFITEKDYLPGLEEVFLKNPGSRYVRWKPGEYTSYSNDAFSLLAVIIEKVTGQKYEDYIQQNILDKIGAGSTTYLHTEANNAHFAQGYANDGSPVEFVPVLMRPSGGINSDITDLAKFVMMLLNNGDCKSGSVIDSVSYRKMLRPSSSIPAREGFLPGYGSGFSSFIVNGQLFYGHGGGLPDFNSLFLIDPDQEIGIAILINQNSDYFWKLPEAVVASLNTNKYSEMSSQIYTAGKIPVENLTGFYSQANYGINLDKFPNYFLSGQTVTFVNDTLFIHEFNGDNEPLVNTGGNAYRKISEQHASVYFFRNSKGKMMLTNLGKNTYCKDHAWIPAMQRIFLVFCIVVIISYLLFSAVWLIKFLVQRLRGKEPKPYSFMTRIYPLLAIISFLIFMSSMSQWFGNANAAGNISSASISIFAFSILFALFSVISFWKSCFDKKRVFRNMTEKIYLLIVSATLSGLAVMLFCYGIIGLRTWAY